MTDQVLLPRATDANDDPLSGALAYIYQTGTTTPVTVYSDTSLATPHANPIVADSAGWFPQAFYGGSTQLKAVIKTAADATVLTLDPVPLAQITGSAASGVSFAPTTDIPDTNVQDAIETVQSNISGATVNGRTLVTTAGTVNAYTVSAADTLLAYALGDELLVRIHATNTGAATLNVDGLGAKNIQKYSNAGSLVALAAGDLITGDVHRVTYDGSRFVLETRDTGPTEQILTSGTAATYTTTPGARVLEVICIGGGGGGGGSDGQGSATAACAGGGGAGGLARILITDPEATYTYTVGTGGAGGAAGNNAGSDGTDSTFTGGAVSLVGEAGLGGSGMLGSGGGTGLGDGGAGGSATGGDLNIPGPKGSRGTTVGGDKVMLGDGANGPLGYGAGGPAGEDNAAGSNATGYGAGGGGGTTHNAATNNAGGDGADGLIIVREYH